MKPLNLDNKPCSPISSNCVVWQGPDISCIELCTGDTVSDVVFAMATELCTILDTLKVSNYDLTCFNLQVCGPTDFQALIQFLIEKICESEGVTPETKDTTGCPDCVVSVAECFVIGTQTTMQLVDYVQLIGQRICSLIEEITLINQQITDILIRIITLEERPDPIVTLPPVNITCVTFPLSGSQQIDVVLDTFINTVWCNFYAATGSTSEIINAVGRSCITEGSSTISKPGTTFGTEYAGSWVNSPLSTLSDAVNNIWIALCDIYNFLNSTNLIITVADTNTIDLELSASNEITAKIQDTGWVELEGFNFYTSLKKPECRRIGNVIHYRGIVTIPLTNPTGGTIVQMTNAESTVSIIGKTPYSGASAGAVSIDTVSQLISFNSGNSVIPSTVVSSQRLDGEANASYPSFLRRPLITTGGGGTLLHSTCRAFFNAAGVLTISSLQDAETPAATADYPGNSSLRLITSNIRVGEKIPNYISLNSNIHSFPVHIAFNNALGYSIGDVVTYSGQLYIAVVNIGIPSPPAVTPDPASTPLSWNVYIDPLQTDTFDIGAIGTYPISIDAGKVEDIGGFFFWLDGTTSFVDCGDPIPSESCY